MTDYALARRNRASELMLDRMAGLVLRNRRIGAIAMPVVAELSIGSGMEWITIVRVDDMTGGAAARAIVSRMIVGPKKGQHRVEQTSLLQAEVHWIGPQDGAQSPRAQQVLCRFSRRFFRNRQANFGGLAASALEGAQDIAHLTNLPAR